MKINCHAVTLIIALTMVSPAQADEFDALRDKVRAMLLEESIPSIAVAVSRHGQVVWEEAFGWADREQRVPATEHTLYSLASISKPITATGLMVLVERGELSLDRGANEYLGDLPLVARTGATREATLRRLTNHTSGLPLHYQFFYADEPHTPPPFAESLRRYGVLMRPPGERFQYANFGYGVLDHIIARQSGQSYAEFMRSEVFLPLGMTHSSVGIAKGLEAHAAVRYATDQTPLPFYDFDHPGASAVFASVHDLIRLGMFHLKQRGADQRAILKDETIDAMQQPTADVGDGRHYGIGWFIQPDENGFATVSHSGGMAGVRTRLCLVPSEGLAVAVLCNASSEAPLKLTREILATLLPEYGKRVRKEPKHDPESAGKAFAPPELVGYWQGQVSTPDGARPIQMWVQPDGDVHVQLDDQLRTVLNNSSLRDSRWTGVFAGDLATVDAQRRPYHLELDANLRGELINGSLTAKSLPSPKAGNALSYWIELQRVDTNPQTTRLFNGTDLAGWHVIDQYDFARHGHIHVQDAAIILPAGTPATGLRVTQPFPRVDYEVSLEAKRIDGNDFFCGLTFPVGENYLSLILGGWGGGVTGISNLDNMPAVENATTGYFDFVKDRWYKIRLRVTADKVEAWVDDEQIVDLDSAKYKLSIWWEQEPVRPFGIATWYTKGAVRKIYLKRL